MNAFSTAKPEVRRGALRWLAREIFGCFFVFALLFASAGTLNWPGAWLMIAVYVIWVAVNAVLLLPRSPELLAERARREMGPSRIDNILLGLFGFGVLVKYIAAGLQVRFQGIGMGAAALWIGLALSAVGYGFVTWSMVANAYFVLVARIQAERGQQVVEHGPYAFIRHPGYLGSVLFEIGSPLLLGSTWALWFGLFNAATLILRTYYEDQMLRESLHGYAEYAQRVRSRLIPGIW